MSRQKLQDRVAIVTGASSGIGKEVALAFGREGARVIAAARSVDKLASVVDEIRSLGSEAEAFAADLSSENANAELVKFTLEKFGSVHVAFINAGSYKYMDLDDVTEEVIDSIFGINYKSVVFGLKHLIPAMRNTAEDKGSIIITSSCLAASISTRMAHSMIYASSKAAVKTIMHYAAIIAADKVRVNSIAPGLVRTEMNRFISDEDIQRYATEMTLMTRPGSVKEIAPLAVLLACDDGSFATGAEFNVDGGWTLCA